MSDVSGTPAVPASFIASAVAAGEDGGDKKPISSVTYSIRRGQGGSVVGMPQNAVAPPSRAATSPVSGPHGGTGGSRRRSSTSSGSSVGRSQDGKTEGTNPMKFAAVARSRTLGAKRSDQLSSELVKIKIVIYGGLNMEGKKLYCKFYHGSCKHKTSTAVSRRNPEWKEWFGITHLVNKQSAVIRIEIWGGGFLGKEVKGFCDVDLTPVLHDHVLIDGLYDVRGIGGQLRVKLINMDLLPRWERTIAAEAALRAIGEEDPDGVLALMIDDLKRMFPAIPYAEIARTLRAHDWRKIFAINELKTIGHERAKRAARLLQKRGALHVQDPGQGCLSLTVGSGGMGAAGGPGGPRLHESFMDRKRRHQIREVAKMLPDVDVEEIEYTLRACNWNVCAAVDELIIIHRDTEGPQDTTISDDRKLTQLETLAEAGGFVAVQTDTRGSLEVRHSSALPPPRQGVGDRKFKQRLMMFESGKL
ncbi:c2 domain protein [Cystoisospora suis]|uniref:C2 domain protein n=1 Tax=Cystoisospora suis TaxID=483139 RepID=A0A2C6KJF2_9APIC|nr:c2 domain protein [Cystoisospora suis]